MKLTSYLLILSVLCGLGNSIIFDTLFDPLSILFSLAKSFTFRTVNFFTGGCAECILLADLIILLRRIGTTRGMYMALFEPFCRSTVLIQGVDYEVCIGLVDKNLDPILYIIDNHFTMDGIEFCSTALQYEDCVSTPADWSVNIPLGQSVPTNQTPSSQNQIVVAQITDLHYDSRYAAYSNNKCDRPLCCENLDNSTVVANDSMAGYWTDYTNCDIPSYFVENALKDIESTIKPDYVYFTGDIISHDSWARTKQRDIDDFTFLSNMLATNFPNAEIFPILGNHDTYPLNLFSPRKMDNTSMSVAWLFEAAYEAWKPFLPESTKDTILKGGYYTTKTKDGLRIIALNNNVGYCLNFWILDEPVDPYGQLQWFADTLLAAERANEKVHVLMHLPNGDSTMVIPFGKNFRNIVLRFRYTITGMFCGHTHLGEHEIVYDGTTPTNVIWNGGSLTPFYDLNPNYRIYQLDGANFNILDFAEYIIPDLSTANLDTTTLVWEWLYSFKQQYNVPDMSAASIANLAYRMAQSKELRTLYYNNTVRFAPPSLEIGCDDSCDETNLCKMVTSVYGDDAMCKNLTNSIV